MDLNRYRISHYSAMRFCSVCVQYGISFTRLLELSLMVLLIFKISSYYQFLSKKSAVLKVNFSSKTIYDSGIKRSLHSL
jgi:hypothetical protein